RVESPDGGELVDVEGLAPRGTEGLLDVVENHVSQAALRTEESDVSADVACADDGDLVSSSHPHLRAEKRISAAMGHLSPDSGTVEKLNPWSQAFVTKLMACIGRAYICRQMASANSDVLRSVAPSIWRWKS